MIEFSADAPIDLKDIFENSPLGLLLVDEDYRILDVNPSAKEILGREKEKLQGSKLIDLIEIEYRADLINVFERVKGVEEISGQTEIRIMHPEVSKYWVEISLGRLDSGDFLIIVQDIQTRKKIEQEVEELHRCLNDRVEMERIQLAQDLHDGAVQDLHSIQYQLSALQSKHNGDLQKKIETVMETVQKVRSELRRISYDLRPPTLSRFGLAKSIRRHAEEFEEKHPEIDFQLNLDGGGSLLPEEIRLALFRIYQQAVGNVLQHSSASKVKISLIFEGSTVIFRIEDDGIGFSPPTRWITMVRKGHYGLAGSKERVNNLGGTFEVFSKPGEGTVITVTIPKVIRKKI
jgi:two-component system sensor histidine kinase UhpB